MKKLFFLMLIPFYAYAQETSVEPDLPESEPQPTVEEPAAQQLTGRELGESFRNFRPSEEISADNAVPFPIDI